MAKRVLDVVVSAFLLVALAPLLLIVALVVGVGGDRGGPVLFRQERVGRHGRIFRIHKFRTMSGGPGRAITADSDTRITRVGRILRATKLDELPQIYDVLVGNMSLVGPRPELAKFVAYWPPAAREVILSVRPGITNPASIAYRNQSAELAQADDPEDYYVNAVLPVKVEMYLTYVRTRSFLGDLRILVRTALALLDVAPLLHPIQGRAAARAHPAQGDLRPTASTIQQHTDDRPSALTAQGTYPAE